MSKFLITGGAGFIGSNIAERLLKDGHFVRVLDNFSSGKEENLSFVTQCAIRNTQYELIRGDIRDYNTCLKACEDIDYILHQAALRSVPKSMERPHEYNEVNIDGTVNMLEASRKNKVKRFVLASSSSIYGDTDVFPQKEEHLPLLISPYALTKLTGEYYCRIFSENFGLDTVSLRYFNVFGPRQALDDEYAVVIPKFIHCILNNEQPPIFGNGKQSRDFTYIDNVVQANILAATICRHCEELQTPLSRHCEEARSADVAISETRTSHEVFNIANGQDNTVLGLVNILNEIIGKSITPEFKPVRQGDVFRTLADISKARKLLGYQSKVGFREGLEKTVSYFRTLSPAILTTN